MSEQKIVYASVDLELTGFDPLVDEIVEIGVVLFEVRDGQCQVVQEWQSLIKPSGSLHARIQGLTGITAQDLESAPVKELVVEYVCTMLRGAVLVGHGVSLDKRFLEAFGVPVSTVMVDTLELAQIFLPTYHSYNLENLSHVLLVEHSAAHRALSDAQATLGVLRALIGIFWSLPESVRTRVIGIANRRNSTWADLFMRANNEQFAGSIQTAAHGRLQSKVAHIPIPPSGQSSTLCAVEDVDAIPWQALADSSQAWVVALPSRDQVLDVAKYGFASPFLGVAEAVSARAIRQAEDVVEHVSEREALALLKVLVWQAGQTQETALLAEINWSLLGTDFKKRFAEVRPFPQVAGVVAVDYRSLAGVPAGKSLWISEVDKYIAWLEQQSGQTLSWQGIIHQFRQIYNPENGFGDASKAAELQEAVIATDIFYVSVLFLLKKYHGFTQGVVARSEFSPFVEDRLTLVGKNYARRLRRLLGLRQDKVFLKILESVEAFFEAEASVGVVRWVEIADGRCVFVSRPLSLTDDHRGLLRSAQRTVYTTDLHSQECLSYITRRLGVEQTHITVAGQPSVWSLRSPRVLAFGQSLQRDALVVQTVAGSTACLVFPNQTALKLYYDQQFGASAHKQGVIAVGIHGGVNKVLRNFAFSKKSVVLLTQQALIAFDAARIQVQKVVYVGITAIDVAHPFTAALVVRFFDTCEEGVSVLQAFDLAESLRPFGPALDRPESYIMVLEQESRVSTRVVELL